MTDTTADDPLRRIVAAWESLRDETFSFQHNGATFVWNVTRAWQFVSDAPRPPDYFRPSEQGVTAAHLSERYPSLDWEYARGTDLSKPLLFVPYQGRAQLIDGWHRLAKAVLEGIEELPAYLLTEAESEACLIVHRPNHTSPTGTQWQPWRDPEKGGKG